MHNPFISNYTETSQTLSGDQTINLDNGTVIHFFTSGTTTLTIPEPIAGKVFRVNVHYVNDGDTVTFVGLNHVIYWNDGVQPTNTSLIDTMDSYIFMQDEQITYGIDFGKNYNLVQQQQEF